LYNAGYSVGALHTAGGGGSNMKRLGLSAAAIAVALGACASSALAADLPLPANAPLVSPASTACGTPYDFFFTSCPLSWYGVTFFGIVDLGGTYQTHGTPLDPNHPVGASYLLGNSGTNAANRNPGFGFGPNALSQSNVGVKIAEPIVSGWTFVAEGGFAFDPYSFLLANAPQAMFNAIGVPENRQLVPYDSSRWGFLAAQNYAGVSSPVYGTVTFGRQNTPMLDAVNGYDPMGGSYAFSVIGNSGKTCGDGDTETCRQTTAIKYRENIGNFRLVAMLQPVGLFGGNGGFGAYNPDNGSIEGGIGGDFKNFGPGTLSVDVLGAFEKDAVNWSTLFPGQTTVNGWPTSFPGTINAAGTLGSGLKATISNNTSIMAVAKYSFGSWGEPAPIVGKSAPAPSGPTGIPLTLYAGYEWIQFDNPSDPQSVFHDDGFLFTATNAAASTLNPLSGTTIANNAFNSHCGSGVGCEKEYFQVIWAGAKYGITKDLDVIGAYYHYIQDAFVIAPAATCVVASANSRCAGFFDGYSAVIDWRFLPKWDAYIGTFYTAAFGGLANGDITRNNLATTAGVRFRF
jgi:hypothetical protein